MISVLQILKCSQQGTSETPTQRLWECIKVVFERRVEDPERDTINSCFQLLHQKLDLRTSHAAFSSERTLHDSGALHF